MPNGHSNDFFPSKWTLDFLFNSPPSSLPQLSAWPQYSLNIYTFIPVSRHLHFSLQCISSCNHFSTMQSATVMHSHRCVHLLLLFIYCKNFNQSCHPCLSPECWISWAGLPGPLPFPHHPLHFSPSDHTAVPPSHRRYSKLDAIQALAISDQKAFADFDRAHSSVTSKYLFSGGTSPTSSSWISYLSFQSFSTPSIFLHNLFTSTWFNVFTFFKSPFLEYKLHKGGELVCCSLLHPQYSGIWSQCIQRKNTLLLWLTSSYTILDTTCVGFPNIKRFSVTISGYFTNWLNSDIIHLEIDPVPD